MEGVPEKQQASPFKVIQITWFLISILKIISFFYRIINAGPALTAPGIPIAIKCIEL